MVVFSNDAATTKTYTLTLHDSLPIGKQRAAEQVGLRAGDVIVSIPHQRVQSLDELKKVLDTKPDVIALNVIRGKDSIYLLMR